MLSCLKASSTEDQAWQRSRQLSWPTIGTQHNKTAQCTGLSIESLPYAAVAKILQWLPFDSRCQAACVCKNWAAIVNSAAAESEEQCSPIDCVASRAQPCDVVAVRDDAQCRLQQCSALKHATSATVWASAVGYQTLQQLQALTRLHLVDIRCDAEGRSFSPLTEHTVLSLQHLTRLQVLNLGMAAPIVDFTQLPTTLRCLHLNLASGYSVGQLQGSCAALASAAPRLPHLQHISLGLELDALLRSSQGAVLNPLSAITHLTSLALVEYQYMHPDSPAHEGYALVPPLLQQLPGLQQVDLRLCSGQFAQLAPAAGVPDVRLVLTLARHEQVQFNRLPSSLALLTGLTSLSILMAEFEYEPGSELFVFDASPLALCHQLRTLLLELHGAKSSQHDLRGLAQLQGLQDLSVLFKCPDVHEARPEIVDSEYGGSAGVAGVAAAVGGRAASAGSSDGSMSGLSRWLSRTTSFLRRASGKGGKALLNSRQSRAESHGGVVAAVGSGDSSCEGREVGSSSTSLLCEEWLLQLLDTALDQLRPEFALTVPKVAGRLLLATTSRLLLRQPDMVYAAKQPLLLCSNLQLDCDASGDMWSGECFLHRRTASELKAWVTRNWQPHGIELLAAARYPQLGSYPGCRQRIDDKLLVVAPRGTTGRQVVQTVMSTAEECCMAYFT